MNIKRFLTQRFGDRGITSEPMLAFVVLPLLIALAACASSSEPTPTPTASADKLAEIVARGTLIVATDPNYAPQSELKEDVARAANTRHTPTVRDHLPTLPVLVNSLTPSRPFGAIRNSSSTASTAADSTGVSGGSIARPPIM